MFPGPSDRRRWPSDVNTLLSKMSERSFLVYVGKREEETTFKVDNKILTYSKAPMYDVSDRLPLIAIEEFSNDILLKSPLRNNVCSSDTRVATVLG